MLRLTIISASLIMLVFLLLASAPSVHGQIGGAHPAAMVLAEQQKAWNDGDIPAFMSGYWNSPQLSFSSSTGVSRGWDVVLTRYRHKYPDKAAMGHLDFSDLEIHTLGDSAAMVLGKWHLKRSSGDIGGVFTLVFQKFPDGWKIIHDHTSQVLEH